MFIPGQDVIPEQATVRSYPILERQEVVWIWMGDPDLADESKLLVDFPWNDDHEHWPHMHDVYEIECSYQLLIDNLMDLTHIPFIHRTTIGGGSQMGQVGASMDVTPTDKIGEFGGLPQTPDGDHAPFDFSPLGSPAGIAAS